MFEELSILVPGIRPHNWTRLYNSIDSQMEGIRWSIVFVGPFDPPVELANKPNLIYEKSYDRPTVAVQKGMQLCDGHFIYHTVDDGYCLPNSLKPALQLAQEHNTHFANVVNGTYKEGADFNGNSWLPEAWTAGFHSDLRLPLINPAWKISLQPIMRTETFFDIGGFNCQFEYLNHAFHDMIFRLQRLGGTILDSPTEICCAGHMPGTTGDHAPIHNSQTGPDQLLFNLMYSTTEPPTHIDYNNYRIYEGVWERRFKRQYATYEEMCNL